MRGWPWVQPALLALLQASAGAETSLGSVPVEDAGTLTWLVGDVGVARTEKTRRPSDTLLDWLMHQLPDLKQPRMAVNGLRGWQLLSTGQPVCHSNMARTPEREAQLYFSNTALYATPQVYVRPELVKPLPRDAHGEVDLPRLLADPQFTGAVVQSRSYGVTIDAWLRERSDAPWLQRHVAPDFGSNMLPLLTLGRVDYVIEYPAAVSTLAHQVPAVRTLVGLPIAGTDKVLTVGVACPRTPWGLAMIRRVDQALSSPQGVALLRKAMDRDWPREAQRSVAERIEAFFARRSRPSPDL